MKAFTKYTSHIDFELITINNGSSDGTAEYFNSLPNQKKISFPKNIGVCKAINQGSPWPRELYAEHQQRYRGYRPVA